MNEGQLSDDGRWRWDGARWVPVGEMAIQPAYPSAGYAPAPPTNSLAIASLVFGILGWVMCPVVGSVVAVICGHMARSRIRATGEAGGGLAMAGLLLGYIALGAVIIVALFYVLILIGVMVSSAPH